MVNLAHYFMFQRNLLELVHAILMRAELGLFHLTLAGKTGEIFEERKKLVQMYILNFEQVLKFVLGKIHNKGLDPTAIQFIHFFCSMAYFRSPYFR